MLALLGQSLEDTRTLTFELSPPVLYELGLSAALHWLAALARPPRSCTPSIYLNSMAAIYAEARGRAAARH